MATVAKGHAHTAQNWHYVKPRSTNMNEQYYKECVEQAASYNARLSADRRMRLPFLDTLTGVAQSHTELWMPYRYRGPGKRPGQLYTYPAKRWKMKHRAYQIKEAAQLAKAKDTVENGETEKKQMRQQLNGIATEKKNVSDEHKISAVENPAVVEGVVVPVEETSRDQWYDDMENLSDPPDAGEIDDNSSSSDFEDTYIKKKKKKKKPAPKGGRGKKKTEKDEPKIKKDFDPEDPEKPYGCELCGARYKTRPGLTYHLSHFHSGGDDEEEAVGATLPSPKQHQGDGSTGATVNSAGDVVDANNYCDFCLGDESKNKKTGKREELVTCSECGRAGHPTCLQFTANMILSVKRYPWQCIECKSCAVCGTSENDDQLLFCDDCDRGYHMYCLNPPLSEPPEGSWSCHLCIIEFYGGKKPEGME